MTTLLQEYEAPIADCLEQYATGVRAIGDAGWEFTLPGEVPLLVTARLKKGWLRLCSPLSVPSSSRPTPEILDRMLAQNIKLCGGAKFTLADDPPLPCLAAEILLDEEQSDLGVKIARACDGFGQALQEFAGERRGASRTRKTPRRLVTRKKPTNWLLTWRRSAKRRAGRWSSVPATRWRSSWMLQAVSARPWCNPGGRKVFISESTWRVPRPAASPAGMH